MNRSDELSPVTVEGEAADALPTDNRRVVNFGDENDWELKDSKSLSDPSWETTNVLPEGSTMVHS
jgi:hypothetical protein